jgi:hypothetical protein
MPKLSFIKYAASELEGWFQDIPDPENHVCPGVKGDGSVEAFTVEENRIIDAQRLKRGERNSIPHSKISDLRKWMTKYFPIVRNRSTGLHFHISTIKEDHRLKILGSREFHSAFLKSAKEFVQKPKYKFNTTMIERVLYGNGYCRHDYSYDPSHGSAAIDPTTDHGTCEFRLFSGDCTVRQAKLILSFIVSFCESYIEEALQREASKKVGIVYKSYNGESL